MLGQVRRPARVNVFGRRVRYEARQRTPTVVQAMIRRSGVGPVHRSPVIARAQERSEYIR